MEGLQSWRIVDGPSGFTLWFNRLLGRQTTFELERHGEMNCLVGAIQSLDDQLGVMSFLGGRLFKSGQVILLWGEYDTRSKTGQFWLLPVPDPYTPCSYPKNMLMRQRKAIATA